MSSESDEFDNTCFDSDEEGLFKTVKHGPECDPYRSDTDIFNPPFHVYCIYIIKCKLSFSRDDPKGFESIPTLPDNESEDDEEVFMDNWFYFVHLCNSGPSLRDWSCLFV